MWRTPLTRVPCDSRCLFNILELMDKQETILVGCDPILVEWHFLLLLQTVTVNYSDGQLLRNTRKKPKISLKTV
jgi:hypothetical protein